MNLKLEKFPELHVQMYADSLTQQHKCTHFLLLWCCYCQYCSPITQMSNASQIYWYVKLSIFFSFFPRPWCWWKKIITKPHRDKIENSLFLLMSTDLEFHFFWANKFFFCFWCAIEKKSVFFLHPWIRKDFHVNWKCWILTVFFASSQYWTR